MAIKVWLGILLIGLSFLIGNMVAEQFGLPVADANEREQHYQVIGHTAQKKQSPSKQPAPPKLLIPADRMHSMESPASSRSISAQRNTALTVKKAAFQQPVIKKQYAGKQISWQSRTGQSRTGQSRTGQSGSKKSNGAQQKVKSPKRLTTKQTHYDQPSWKIMQPVMPITSWKNAAAQPKQPSKQVPRKLKPVAKKRTSFLQTLPPKKQQHVSSFQPSAPNLPALKGAKPVPAGLEKKNYNSLSLNKIGNGKQSRGSLRVARQQLPQRPQLQQPQLQDSQLRLTETPAPKRRQVALAALPRATALPRLTGQRMQKRRPANQAGPFEVIDQAGDLSLTVRRSKILRTKDDIYRISVVDPTICDVVQFTPREISVIGKGQGATHVTFWFKGIGKRPVTYLVRVLPDIEERRRLENTYKILEKVIAKLYPDSKVRLISVADKLIVRGQAKGSAEAAQILALIRGEVQNRQGRVAGGSAAQVLTGSETGRTPWPKINVINMLQVPGIQQVALRVKIAEVSRSAARGFGVDFKGKIDFSSKNGSGLILDSMLNVINGGSTAILGQFDGDDISVGIRFLQQHGVLRVLSEPTLVTMSGKSATFVAGGEFAVPTIVGNGGLNAVTTDFRSFGVILSFLPTVIDKDRIRLEVAPEFSSLNSDLQVGSTPGLNVRAVTTTVEMREGQTLAIAGLLEDTMNGDKTGDLPWLGRIFGRRNMNRKETELVILITPELVHPMEPEEVPPLPGFDITEPTNKEFFLRGKIEGHPLRSNRSTVWPRLRRRYRSGGSAMISGPFGHGQ